MDDGKVLVARSRELGCMQTFDSGIETLAASPTLSSDLHQHHPPIGNSALALDQALALHAIDQPGDVGHPMQHSLPQRSTGLASWAARHEQTQQVELGERQPMSLKQLLELVDERVCGRDQG